MIRYDFAQRSEDWYRARLGVATSSEFHRIVTPAQGNLSKQAPGYMYVLLAEWMTGAPLPDYSSDFMERGANLEAEAVSAYEFETGLQTEKVGFITDDAGMVGCSPDRLVMAPADRIGTLQDGCLEIKCPAANTHVGHMIERKLDEKHAPQTQGQLLITCRAWIDTVSYFPGLPIVIIRTPRREDYIQALEAALDSFVKTMLKARDAIVQRYGEFPIVKPKPLPEDFGTFGVSDEDAKAIWQAHQEAQAASETASKGSLLNAEVCR